MLVPPQDQPDFLTFPAEKGIVDTVQIIGRNRHTVNGQKFISVPDTGCLGR